MGTTYELIIKNQTTGGGGSKSSKNDNKEESENNLAELSSQALKTASYLAYTMISEQLVSRVGETRRDSLLQSKIDVGMSVGSTAIAFAVHPVLGVATLGYKMIGLAQQSYDYHFKQRQEDKRLSIIGERAGNMNRSR